MIRLSANLSMLFTEVPLIDRFAAAAAAGFNAVEIQFPYELEPRTIREELQRHELELILFNFPAGDWAAGDRGIAADWERRDEFQRGMAYAQEWIDVLHPRFVNLLAGASEDTDHNDLALLQHLGMAAEMLGEEEVSLLVESINTHDVPGFALPTAFATLDVIAALELPNIKFQLDTYHLAQMQEDPIAVFRDHADQVGHIQIADFPGRHEPGSGDIAWNRFFHTIEASGYAGHVGLEYIPRRSTDESLEFMRVAGLLPER